jgi:hypothetical protein
MSTPLHEAVRRYSLEDVQRCVSADPSLLNEVDEHGETALFLAKKLAGMSVGDSQRECLRITRYLLEMGADPNIMPHIPINLPEA